MLWSELRLNLKTSSVTPDFFLRFLSNLIIFYRQSKFKKKLCVGSFWARTSLRIMDWHILFTGVQSCEELLGMFQKVLSTGLDLLMLVRRVRINTNDAPWMTSELRSLILKWQRAFHEHRSESVQFKFYRNAVNRRAQTLFYETKIA